MGLWLVAAVAAAGYVAKYWQNPPKNNGSLSQLASEENIEPPSCPFSRLVRRKKSDKTVPSDGRDLKGKVYDRNPRTTERLEDSNKLTISNLLPALISDSNLVELGDVNPKVSDSDNVSYSGALGPDTSAGQVAHAYRSYRRKTPLRSIISGAQVVRPLNSLESCLMAQLYNEHSDMEEYVFSSFPSLTAPVVRPLLVRDGSQIISSVNGSCFSPLVGEGETHLQKEGYQGKSDHVIGVCPLPEFESFSNSKEEVFETRRGSSGGLTSGSTFNRDNLSAQRGSFDGTLLFLLGVSIGAMSSITANKREVDRLNELLKQTENLVDDLHEELEMKDSITVKELGREDHELQDTIHSSNCDELNASPEQRLDDLTNFNFKGQNEKKAEQNSDSLSRIEAELEAEFERLGLNMDSSATDRRIGNPIELDQDFFTEFACGELRVNIEGGKDLGPSTFYDDKAENLMKQTGYYAVPPQELSLRLHEVIESRLGERIKELEEALENSQRKVQLLESRQKKHDWRGFSDCEVGFPPSTEIPMVDSTLPPFVMDLSGEALDAYNEAYEEIMKMDISEEDSPSGLHLNKDEIPNSCQRCADGVQSGRVKHMAFSSVNSQKFSSEVLSSEQVMPKGKASIVCEMNFDDIDDNSDSDDLMERHLIREIVARTKREALPLF